MKIPGLGVCCNKGEQPELVTHTKKTLQLAGVLVNYKILQNSSINHLVQRCAHKIQKGLHLVRGALRFGRIQPSQRAALPEWDSM